MPFVKKGNRRGFNFRRNDQLSENDNSEKDSDQITTPEQSEFLTLREDDTANELLPEYTEESESSVDPLLLMAETVPFASQNQMDIIAMEINEDKHEPNDKLYFGQDIDTRPVTNLASNGIYYCRLCLTSLGQHYISREHIFKNKSNIRYSLAIEDCIGLTVDENDGYSSLICSSCKKLLLEFYNFRVKCRNSDDILKQAMYRDLNTNKMASIDGVVTFPNVKTEKIYDVQAFMTCDESNACQNIKATVVYNQMATDVKAIHEITETRLTDRLTSDAEKAQHLNITPHFSLDIIKSKKERPRKRPYKNTKATTMDNNKMTTAVKLTDGTSETTSIDTLISDAEKAPHLNITPHFSLDIIKSRKKRPRKRLYKNIKATTMDNNKMTTAVKSTDGTTETTSIDTQISGAEETPDLNKKPDASFQTIKSRTKRPYLMCDVCGVMVSTLRHMMVHDTETQYIFKCATCGKGFSRKNAMQNHSRCHLSVKPFPCKSCDMSFVSKHKLDIHHVVHTGKREHQCHLCEKRFQTRYNLRTHIRSHTGERPYKCPHCELTFIHRATLNPHVKKCAADALKLKLVILGSKS